MQRDNYITVLGWMINDLKLKQNELLIYALIHGFSQDGRSKFTGSITYICKTLKLSRPTAINLLKNLVDKKYLIKHQTVVNNVVYNSYSVGSKETLLGSKEILQGSKEILQIGSKETLPNNTSINNTNNIDICALDFLKENYTTIYDALIMQHKKNIKDWALFVSNFNAVVDKEKLEYDPRVLKGRFIIYANNWVQNQNKSDLKVIKDNDVVRGPSLRRIG